jgi:hypothetical protein
MGPHGAIQPNGPDAGTCRISKATPSVSAMPTHWFSSPAFPSVTIQARA